MSAGKVHTKASLILTGGFLLGGILMWMSPWGYMAGSLIGVLISPDTDVDAGTVSNRYIRKRLGWVSEKMWDGVWWMYRRSLKHGGELSHFPIIGTLGRIVYLFLFLIVIPEAVLCTIRPQMDFWYELGWWVQFLQSHYKVVLGLMGADFIHYSLDILTTEHVNKKRPAQQSAGLVSKPY